MFRRSFHYVVGARLSTSTFKCDGQVAAAAISGGSGLIGGIYGGFVANRGAKRLAREQMAWQTREREAQNAWNEKMWAADNEYNSAVSQVARLRAAGINPQVAMDNGGSGLAGVSSAPAASGSGVTNPSYPTLVNPFSNVTNDVSMIAGALKNLADAKKSGVDTKFLEESFEARLKREVQDSNISEQEAFIRTIEHNLKAKWGDKQLQAEWNKTNEEMRELQTRQNLQDAQKLLARSEQELASAKSETERQMRKHLVDAARKNVDLISSQIDLNNENVTDLKETRNSRIALNRSSAFNASQLAELSYAKRLELVSSAIALYEDETGVHIDERKADVLRSKMLKEISNHVRQQGQDYWNPFNYVGHALGASASAGVGVSKIVYK